MESYLKGKTYTEVFGKEKSDQIKKKKSKSTKGRKNWWVAGDRNPMRREEVKAKAFSSERWENSLFQKGHVPWDKGLSRPEMMGERNPSKRPEVIEKIKSKLGPGSKHWAIVTSIGYKEKVGKATTKRYLNGGFNYHGYFFSQKNNAMIGYRSKDELKCMEIFEQLSKLKRWEYEKDKVSYVDEKEQLRHTIPDFHLYWDDGSEEIIEYKPTFKIIKNLHGTSLKLNAMKDYANRRDMKFSIWTENELNLQKKTETISELERSNKCLLLL